MVQINTGQKFSIAADPEDAAGYDVDVPVSYAVADETVATLAPFADDAGNDDPKSRWVVSGAPGSTVVTVTVPTVEGEPDLAVTLAVDVVAAGVATIDVTTGDPVDE